MLKTLPILSTEPCLSWRANCKARWGYVNKAGATVQAILGTEPGQSSSRSQFRGCLNGGTASHAFSDTGVRVDGHSSEPSGAQRANKEAQSRGHSKSKVGKRSYRKAIFRAEKYGKTMYRGRTIHGGPKAVRVPRPEPTEKDRGRRGIFSWNAGGISAELYAELFRYLDLQDTVDVAVIQETHWSTSGEWRTGQWQCIHSASGRKNQDGVLVAIRSSLLGSSEVCWQEVAPGRLLRVRATLEGQHWEIFGLYQHAMTSGGHAGDGGVFDKRQRIWSALDKSLSAVPFRGLITLAGDFNMAFIPAPPTVGHGVKSGSSCKELDDERGRVIEILSRHRLTVLNSWGKKSATYKHPTGDTQIDFVVVRQQHSDRRSKQAKPIRTCLAAWRRSGHEAVFTTVRAQWRPWLQRPSEKEKRPQQHVPERERQIQTLRARIRDACEGRVARPKLPQLAPVTEEIESHWQLRRKLGAAWNGVSMLRIAFRSLRLHADAQQAHKLLKKACRKRKRDRLLDGLARAEQASKNGDSKSFFGFARLVAPKPFLPQIKLRDPGGGL